MNLTHEQHIEMFANACNRIHASLKIPSIMRAIVTSSLELIDAETGMTGLFMEDEMVFSEYCRGDDVWTPFSHRSYGGTDAVGQLIRNGHAYLSNDPEQSPQISKEMATALGGIERFVAVPIYGKQDGLLASLLLFNKRDGEFNEDDLSNLEHLASIASIAIDNAIQVSENHRVEMDLQKSVATYKTLVEQIPAITYIATLDRSRILFVSPQIQSILGYEQERFLAEPDMWQKQIHPDDRDRVLAEVKQSIRNDESFHTEYRIKRECGEELWFKDAAAVVRDNDQALYLQGVMYDITERKQFEKKLLQMAHFDQLTGLANRSLFHDRLNQTIAMAKRNDSKFAVLYLDLDGFKEINDTLGHEAGDQVLKEAANRMRSVVRAIDTVARMGGDEFTIILGDIGNADDVILVAEKVLAAIAAPYGYSDSQHHVTVSIGAAIYPDHADDGDKLVTMADNAMYEAKNNGKNNLSMERF